MPEQLLWIALATFVSEDLACLATGVLVAQGKLGFLPGTVACLLGIFGGDLLLYAAGRFAGRPVLRYVSAEKVAHASEWMSRRGMIVVLLSRFTPGLRLPTYVAAGLLKTRFLGFASYFLVAAAIWTPLLVGAAALLGSEILGATRWFAVIIIAAIVLRTNLRRAVRWEFWPAWAIYIPLVPYLLYLAIKYRSLTLFTVTNPGMPSSGFVGESKSQILEHLSAVEGAVARFALVGSSMDFEFPVVLKPDVGERGSGVAIIRSQSELDAYMGSAKGRTIVQEYVPGVEFGVFYYHYPGERDGCIFSITEKRFPEVIGDGKATLARLINRDSRASCLAPVYLANRQPDHVPGAGERVRLVEIGSHCRGAIFLNGAHLKTQALEQAIERISRAHPGFYMGRFDVRAASVEAFQLGEFKVIELNGVSAEATHVYDPAVSLFEAYRVMYEQWRMAFEIGAINRARGAEPMPLAAFLRLIRDRKMPDAPRRYYHAGTVEAVD